jgi:hypothetical protein
LLVQVLLRGDELYDCWLRLKFSTCIPYSPNKSISSSRQSLHKPWILGRVPQYFADFVDGRIEAVVEVNEGPVRPKLRPQLLSGNDLTRALQQHDQNLKRLSSQSDLSSVLGQLLGSKVQLIDPETNDRCRSTGFFHSDYLGMRRVYHKYDWPPR